MDWNEMVDLLSLVAIRDNRTVDDTVITTWFNDIGTLGFEESSDAVAAHFLEHPGTWLMAGHVFQRVKAARAKRVERAGTHAEHAALYSGGVGIKGSEAEFRVALTKIRQRVGDDKCPPFRDLRALAAGTTITKSVPNEEARQLIDAQKAARDRALLDDARRPANADQVEGELATVRARSTLLRLGPEAEATAWRQAQEELGVDATRDELLIKAAELADLRQSATAERFTKRVPGARSACPNGCDWGTHEPECPKFEESK